MMISVEVSAKSNDLRIIAAETPAMSFSEGQMAKGYCVDIVNELQRRIGTNYKIEFFPWVRTYKMGLHLENVVLLCPKRTTEREKLFKWAGPVFESSTNFYKKRGTKIEITSLEKAKHAKGILAPRNFYAISHLKEIGFTNIVEVNTIELGLLMLFKGREPLMILEETQVKSLLKEVNKDAKEIEVAFKLGPSVNYFAFSNKTSDDQVEKWQKVLDQMKKDGTMAKFYAKWFQK